jgi:hypothetical protein
VDRLIDTFFLDVVPFESHQLFEFGFCPIRELVVANGGGSELILKLKNFYVVADKFLESKGVLF